ncbi:MAG: hypothetical protein ACK2UM_01675 [Anaerolineales bacterium]|jgi:hypothetical protein
MRQKVRYTVDQYALKLTPSLRSRIIPRWMAFLSLVLALFLLPRFEYIGYASYVFLMWVLLLSVHFLLVNRIRHANHQTAAG